MFVHCSHVDSARKVARASMLSDSSCSQQVDAVTGELRTKQAIDYEAYTNISFDILASDLGTPSLSSVPSPVTVHITDVNDNYPQWNCSARPTTDPYLPSQPCFYNLELRADTLIGYKVQQLLSTDLDLCKYTY